ncbi:hypothetical protein BK140_20535 [Paenibacillus macerans]|nr:hypothetical protein BK140_20535 [Paenibacillus macerans]
MSKGSFPAEELEEPEEPKKFEELEEMGFSRILRLFGRTVAAAMQKERIQGPASPVPVSSLL